MLVEEVCVSWGSVLVEEIGDDDSYWFFSWANLRYSLSNYCSIMSCSNINQPCLYTRKKCLHKWVIWNRHRIKLLRWRVTNHYSLCITLLLSILNVRFQSMFILLRVRLRDRDLYMSVCTIQNDRVCNVLLFQIPFFFLQKKCTDRWIAKQLNNGIFTNDRIVANLTFIFRKYQMSVLFLHWRQNTNIYLLWNTEMPMLIKNHKLKLIE